MINTVAISGRLTRDASVNKAGGLDISVAVNERVKNGEEWEDRPSFFDCVLWSRGRANALEGRLTKGTLVAIQGELRQDRWESNGEKKSRVQVVINEIEVLSSAAKSEAAHEDDIPF